MTPHHMTVYFCVLKGISTDQRNYAFARVIFIVSVLFKNLKKNVILIFHFLFSGGLCCSVRGEHNNSNKKNDFTLKTYFSQPA